MTRLLLLLLLSLATLASRSQPYQPLLQTGKNWDVAFWNLSLGPNVCGPYAGERYFVQGDTMLLGRSYKIIGRFRLFHVNAPATFCYPYRPDSATYAIAAFMREDAAERKVYKINGHGRDTLLYHFNAAVGDTAFTFSGDVHRVVRITDTLLRDGSTRRCFLLRGNTSLSASQNYFMEGVGSGYGLFQDYAPFFEITSMLGCMQRSGQLLWGERCSWIATAVSNLRSAPVYVTWQTSRKTLRIALPAGELSELGVFHLSGQTAFVSPVRSDSEVSLAHLPPGTYLYRLRGRLHTEQGKLLITP